MLAIWLAAFPDLRGPRVAAILTALFLPYIGILWFLRKRVTRVGMAIAVGTAALILLASPVFAVYLFGSVIRAIGMPLPIAWLGVLIVIGHAGLLACALRLAVTTTVPRRTLIGLAALGLVGVALYALWATVMVRSVF